LEILTKKNQIGEKKVDLFAIKS